MFFIHIIAGCTVLEVEQHATLRRHVAAIHQALRPFLVGPHDLDLESLCSLRGNDRELFKRALRIGCLACRKQDRCSESQSRARAERGTVGRCWGKVEYCHTATLHGGALRVNKKRLYRSVPVGSVRGRDNPTFERPDLCRHQSLGPISKADQNEIARLEFGQARTA